MSEPCYWCQGDRWVSGDFHPCPKCNIDGEADFNPSYKGKADLLKQRDALREALEWYADEGNWVGTYLIAGAAGSTVRGGHAKQDAGDRARAALALCDETEAK